VKNVTITLEEEVALWARIRAAERNTSVSRLVGEMLRERMRGDQAYEAAMAGYLARKPSVVSDRRRPYPSRDALHDRTRVR
jgi:hypothetical protein